MLLQSKNRPAGERTFFPMRGKIGPSGINDEAPKGRGKGGPVLLFEAKNRPTGREISAPPETLFITSWYITPSLFLVQTLERKNPHLQESKFLFQNTHILSPSHPHIGTARNLHRLSHHFQIFNSQIFSSSRLLSHTIIFLRFQISFEFKLFFFPANAGNKKESEGILSLVRH